MDLVAILLRRWKTVVVAAAIGGGAGVAYALLAPSWYAAQLVVVPSDRMQDTAAASLAAKLPISLDGVATTVQRIDAVLMSTSVADAVIEKFELDKHYDTEFREHTREELHEHCTSHVDRKSSLVTLSCEDKDPKLALALATHFGEVGNQVFARVSASSAREERRFLEAQVAQAHKDVDDASSKLREFQEKHRLVDLPEQTKATISAMAALQGDMMSKQLELSYLSSFSSSREASVVQLQQQISIMKAKLEQLESTAAPAQIGSAGSSFFPSAMEVPALRFELEQLLRQQKIRETVLLLVTQRYEMAKADEARETSTFQILDHPTAPTFRSRPKRMQIAVFGVAIGITLGIAWIVAPIWWRRRGLHVDA